MKLCLMMEGYSKHHKQFNFFRVVGSILLLVQLLTAIAMAQSPTIATREEFYKISAKTILQLNQDGFKPAFLSKLSPLLNQLYSSKQTFVNALKQLPDPPTSKQIETLLTYSRLDKLQVRSKEFSGDLGKGEVIFYGDVVGQMPQESIDFWATKLLLQNQTGDAYEKMIAEGKVRIKQIDQFIESDYMLYDQKNDVLKLDGNVKIRTPRGFIRGNAAILERTAQKAAVFGDPTVRTDGRIKMLFFTGNSALDIPDNPTGLPLPPLDSNKTAKPQVIFLLNDENLAILEKELNFQIAVFARFKTLKGQRFESIDSFFSTLEETIGFDRFFQYKAKIVRYSEAPRYLLTNQTLVRLEENGIPTEILAKLEAFKNQSIVTQEDFYAKTEQILKLVSQKQKKLIQERALDQPFFQINRESIDILGEPRIPIENLATLNFIKNQKFKSESELWIAVEKRMGSTAFNKSQLRLKRHVETVDDDHDGIPEAWSLTSKSFEKLSEPPLPDPVLKTLSSLDGQRFTDSEDLLRFLKNILGSEETLLYGNRILEQVVHSNLRITEYSLLRLKEDGLSTEILDYLESIKYNSYQNKTEFMKTLRKLLGEDIATKYGKAIMPYALSSLELGKVMLLRSQQVTINKAEGLSRFEGNVELYRESEQLFLKAGNINLTFGAEETLKEARALQNVCLEQPGRVAKADFALFDEVQQNILLENNAEVHAERYNLKGNNIHLAIDVKKSIAQGDNKTPIEVNVYPQPQPVPFHCR
ncbi:MAG: hypothetical protein HQM11_17395 [SAR324 cluster bacterium]|nr:hypothetical protein [SAR324 cluster bacterium]